MILKDIDGERFIVELSRAEFRTAESVFGRASDTDLVEVMRQAKLSGELNEYTANSVIRNCGGIGAPFRGAPFRGLSYEQFYHIVINDRLSASGIGDVGKKKLEIFCKNNPPCQVVV